MQNLTSLLQGKMSLNSILNSSILMNSDEEDNFEILMQLKQMLNEERENLDFTDNLWNVLRGEYSTDLLLQCKLKSI